MNNREPLKVIISGGGTGGHIFPAISIANAIKVKKPDAEILFVGAEDRMEMEKVPAAGYKIIGLPIAGFQRKALYKNIIVLIKLYKSLRKAKKIVKEFKPDVAIGVGGYASGPLLKVASKYKIPVFIQEQNSYAGVTNKLLAKKAKKIFVAYDGMEKYFPSEKIIVAGNPVRQGLEKKSIPKDEALLFFGLKTHTTPTLLCIGGSLGARTINRSIIAALKELDEKGIQVIWQTGKNYFQEASEKLALSGLCNVRVYDFISRMDLAYAAADVIISRAGASSISELCIIGKPAILVPSPNVAEDHQTKNAMALVNKQAAKIVTDAEAEQQLIATALALLSNKEEQLILSGNIEKLALYNSSDHIVDEIIKELKIEN